MDFINTSSANLFSGNMNAVAEGSSINDISFLS